MYTVYCSSVSAHSISRPVFKPERPEGAFFKIQISRVALLGV
nr:MAG TPA: hypothetical protein [Caudoviricetes sp.]